MLWFRARKIAIKKGCLPVALNELKYVMGKKRAFIVTDSFLYHNEHKPITDRLDELGIEHQRFDVLPDPTLSCAKAGAEQMKPWPIPLLPSVADLRWTPRKSCG